MNVRNGEERALRKRGNGNSRAGSVQICLKKLKEVMRDMEGGGGQLAGCPRWNKLGAGRH